MPEGDTVFRTAARLRPVLVGQTIRRSTGRDPALQADSLIDHAVVAVEARGKHLLIHVDDQRTIHSHLGMHGAWHLYRVGETWRKSQRLAALSIEAADRVCVCFSPKILELLTASQLRRHRLLARLGPDLLAEHIDEADILARFRVHNPTPVGEAVMNQSIVCGIGNVYKSEILFLTRIDPFVRVGELSDEDLCRVVRAARQWMSKNLLGYPRQTRYGLDGQRLWVYGRNGKSCLVCGTQIRSRRQGDLGRTTYWCPHCQGSSEP